MSREYIERRNEDAGDFFSDLYTTKIKQAGEFPTFGEFEAREFDSSVHAHQGEEDLNSEDINVSEILNNW